MTVMCRYFELYLFGHEIVIAMCGPIPEFDWSWIEGFVSSLTAQVEGGCVAIQALDGDGAVLFADDRFRALLPGAADVVGGITSIWETIDGPRPDEAYSDGPPGWTFVRFSNDPAKLGGEYFIPSERLEALAGPGRDWRREYHYFGELDIPGVGHVIWLVAATQDIGTKRDRYRNEVAGKAVLDAIFEPQARQNPEGLSYRSLPRDGVIGGDFVFARAFPSADDPKRECVVIGDGTSHGVEAALQAVQAGITLRRLVSEESAKDKASWWHADNPATALLMALDDELRASTRQAARLVADAHGRTVGRTGALDASAIVVDRTSGKIFVDGTNLPVWRIREKKGGEITVDRVVGFDPDKQGKHIGVFDIDARDEARDSDHDQDGFARKIKNQKSRRLIAVTDGFIEQRVTENGRLAAKSYGQDRLKHIMGETFGRSRTEALDALVGDWINLHDGMKQGDDALIVVYDIN